MQSFHVVPRSGGPALLTVRDHPEPAEPGPGNVVVRMHAQSVGFRDHLVLTGDYPLPVTPGVVAGCEGAGEVVATGPGVTRVEVGQRVLPTVFPRWLDGPFGFGVAAQLGTMVDGTLTEYMTVSEEALAEIPAHLSYEEAATLPLTALTAWHALTGGPGAAPVAAGETVLVPGTGGVGLAAVQIAALAGARVVAVTSSQEKAKRLVELGAHDVVDRTESPEWAAAVRELTDGRGADRVLHMAGPPAQSVAAAALGGEVVYIGYGVSGNAAGQQVDARALFDGGVRIRPIAVGSRAQLEAMLRAFALHGTRPVVGEVFGFADAPEAVRFHVDEGGFGKTVISGRR